MLCLCLPAQVAQFLRVNPQTGLFFFGPDYRPVPLAQQYIGITEQNYVKRNEKLNEICFSKVAGSFSLLLRSVEASTVALIFLFCTINDQVVESLKQGHQVMVFVHARKDTGRTAKTLVYCNVYLRSCLILIVWTSICCISPKSYVNMLVRVLTTCQSHSSEARVSPLFAFASWMSWTIWRVYMASIRSFIFISTLFYFLEFFSLIFLAMEIILARFTSR